VMEQLAEVSLVKLDFSASQWRLARFSWLVGERLSSPKNGIVVYEYIGGEISLSHCHVGHYSMHARLSQIH
jgi:hypothetical protein